MKKWKAFSDGGNSHYRVLCKNLKTIFTTNFYSKAKGFLGLLQISSISKLLIEKGRQHWPTEASPNNVIRYAVLHIISLLLHITEGLRGGVPPPPK